MRLSAPAAAALSPMATRAETHLRRIRHALDDLHARVAGNPDAEAAADRLHAQLAAGLQALARAPQAAFGLHDLTGGVDPGPKPSERRAEAATGGP